MILFVKCFLPTIVIEEKTLLLKLDFNFFQKKNPFYIEIVFSIRESRSVSNYQSRKAIKRRKQTKAAHKSEEKVYY